MEKKVIKLGVVGLKRGAYVAWTIIVDTDPPIDIDMGIKMSLPGIIANESARLGGKLLEIPQII